MVGRHFLCGLRVGIKICISEIWDSAFHGGSMSGGIGYNASGKEV